MLDNGVPKTLGLKDIIAKYINYQKEIIIRRTKFDLDKAEKRVHILEGYKIALDNIDEVIKIIKEAESDVVAKQELIRRFGFTEIRIKTSSFNWIRKKQNRSRIARFAKINR